jgi:hypothetical protein
MARITHYDQGDVWTPQATFTVNGTPTDPTTLIVRVKDPSGAVTVVTENTPAAPTLPIVRVSAGVFKHNGIALNDAGYWHARFEGTGAAAAAEDHQAIVDPSEFYESAQLGSRALVGLAETKDWLQQQNIETSSDLELARVINDISERFHDEAEREFKVVGTNPQTRNFEIEPIARYGLVDVGDMTTVTTVAIVDTDWATVLETVDTADWAALPLNRKAWEPIRRLQLNYRNGAGYLYSGYRVRVTGNWGFPAVPGNVRQAVLDAVAAVMDRDVEHYRQDLGFGGAAQQAQGGGTVVMVGGGRQRLLSMPPSSLAVAWSYRDLNVG